ncbi:MAG: outer rane autotransporter barrel domain, partial [Hyphomicrobiales bacterium]|nr:outer rane autotransporter barrel domain [Hyphomicrobiales bacterium]
VNSGAINTAGSDSAAILAQSLGGGGGRGGLSASGAGGFGGEGTNLNVSVAVGGSGGSGNVAGKVVVDTSGDLTTTGDGAQGIYAQSIGGGGGNAGGAMSFVLGFNASSSGSSVGANVSVGGSGGSGNLGGAVVIETRSGTIETTGIGSAGILAQSIGGGGGAGGRANSMTVLLGSSCSSDLAGPALAACKTANEKGVKNNFSAAVAVGGSGGSGNNASTVDVTNRQAIITLGANSDGIVAQSIGGGGGTGGDGIIGLGGLLPEPVVQAVAVGSNTIFPTAASFLKKWNVAVGGSGGASGDGEKVTIDNFGAIQTTGNYARGIIAQSVGGGGGDGGNSSAGALGKIGIGGSEGSQGNGGEVLVTNEAGATVWTKGNYATAIFAQSVGGGGGTGGAGSGLINIGGSGSSGGVGGTVTVDNRADLQTDGLGSVAILAQSVGGGGGASAGGGYFPGLVVIGGDAGNGSSGGAVNITNSGSIFTFGDDSGAIFAQSVGGGGGIANETMIDIDGNALPINPGIPLGAIKLGGDFGVVAIGGGGGNGANGGIVTINNSGQVTTHGQNSVGMTAQSIGGGGGSGSRATGLFAMGGDGGATGNGGDVTVTNSGVVTTDGTLSHGILAQSIGGGGGSSASDGVGTGTACNTDTLTTATDCTLKGEAAPGTPGGAYGLVSYGGKAGAAGDGGAVEVDNNTGGKIFTSGDRASAIFAQSIGGGGGAGGNALGAKAVTMGGSDASGDGGTVTVRNHDQLVTAGDFASAIVAQSVGGGGGSGALTGGVNLLGGTGTARGNGALVTVENSALIQTGDSAKGSGFAAYGILAQSIGGGGGQGGANGADTLVLGGGTGDSAGVSLT